MKIVFYLLCFLIHQANAQNIDSLFQFLEFQQFIEADTINNDNNVLENIISEFMINYVSNNNQNLAKNISAPLLDLLHSHFLDENNNLNKKEFKYFREFKIGIINDDLIPMTPCRIIPETKTIEFNEHYLISSFNYIFSTKLSKTPIYNRDNFHYLYTIIHHLYPDNIVHDLAQIYPLNENNPNIPTFEIADFMRYCLFLFFTEMHELYHFSYKESDYSNLSEISADSFAVERILDIFTYGVDSLNDSKFIKNNIANLETTGFLASLASDYYNYVTWLLLPKINYFNSTIYDIAKRHYYFFENLNLAFNKRYGADLISTEMMSDINASTLEAQNTLNRLDSLYMGTLFPDHFDSIILLINDISALLYTEDLDSAVVQSLFLSKISYDLWNQELAFCILGHIYLKQGHNNEAIMMFEKASKSSVILPIDYYARQIKLIRNLDKKFLALFTDFDNSIFKTTKLISTKIDFHNNEYLLIEFFNDKYGLPSYYRMEGSWQNYPQDSLDLFDYNFGSSVYISQIDSFYLIYIGEPDDDSISINGKGVLWDNLSVSDKNIQSYCISNFVQGTLNGLSIIRESGQNNSTIIGEFKNGISSGELWLISDKFGAVKFDCNGENIFKSNFDFSNCNVNSDEKEWSKNFSDLIMHELKLYQIENSFASSAECLDCISDIDIVFLSQIRSYRVILKKIFDEIRRAPLKNNEHCISISKKVLSEYELDHLIPLNRIVYSFTKCLCP
ncbi:MAG TPA: hypothetical protein VFG10_17740 [Saprospiraceae bacterium]|nr:hypothetical protein [Saprospiraceae bacterium]